MRDAIMIVLMGVVIIGLVSTYVHQNVTLAHKQFNDVRNKAYFTRVSIEIIDSGVLDKFFVENENGVALNPYNPEATIILDDLSNSFGLHFEIIIDGTIVYKSPGYVPVDRTYVFDYFYISQKLTVHNLTIVYGG